MTIHDYWAKPKRTVHAFKTLVSRPLRSTKADKGSDKYVDEDLFPAEPAPGKNCRCCAH
jgi:hypothetical protein